MHWVETLTDGGNLRQMYRFTRNIEENNKKALLHVNARPSELGLKLPSLCWYLLPVSVSLLSLSLIFFLIYTSPLPPLVSFLFLSSPLKMILHHPVYVSLWNLASWSHSPFILFSFLSFSILLTTFPFPVHNVHYSTYPLRYPPLRHQDSNCWKSWADLWPGVYGRPHQAGLLLLPFSLQAQAGELRERPVTADQLHLPAGLWGHRAGLQDLWLPLVSDSFCIFELGPPQYVEYLLNEGLTLWFSYRNI